jgi:hypothetical protein
MSKDWALTVGFAGGFFGAVPLYLGLLAGIVAAAAGCVLIWFTIRSARSGSGAAMFGREQRGLA